MKLFQDFQEVSKKQWLDKVTRDLKGKNIDSLTKAVVDGIPISPFFHSDDIVSDIDIPPPTIIPSVLGVSMKIDNDLTGNQLMLESLEGGANFLYIKLEKDYTPNFDLLFDKVLLDLITVIIDCNKENNIESIGKNYLRANYKLTAPDFHFRNSDAVMIMPNGDFSKAILSFMTEGAYYLENIPPRLPLYLQLHLAHDYVQNICMIQAVRLLWANLLEAHELQLDDVPLVVICNVDTKTLSEDQHDNMISITQIAMSMISGGADVIMLPPSDTTTTSEGTMFTRRVSRNIYNLMTMEAYMDRVTTPTAGSYLFDKVSADIAKKHWQQFIKNHTA